MLSLLTIRNGRPCKWLNLLLTPQLLNIQIKGQQSNCDPMNSFIKTLFLFAHMKFEDLAKIDNFFPAFLLKEVIYSSELKAIFSICAQTFSNLGPETSQ